MERIGIRSSTVRTWHGAEVIVPNAQLVTERVTNWTCPTAGAASICAWAWTTAARPRRSSRLLEGVARAHPQIMLNPPPQAVFTAFGDSSINFELRAWTNRFERWPSDPDRAGRGGVCGAARGRDDVPVSSA